MTSELSTDETNYLLAAFAASPREWFRPGAVSAADFSDRQIDRIVETLVRHGLLDAQPDCHARLTDAGRREARKMDKLSRRDWRRFRERKRAILVTSAALVVIGAVVVLLRTGVL